MFASLLVVTDEMMGSGELYPHRGMCILPLLFKFMSPQLTKAI